MVKILSVIVCMSWLSGCMPGVSDCGIANCYEACVKCGCIAGCDCRANEKYADRSWGSGCGKPRWEVKSHTVAFCDGANVIKLVAVPYEARYGLPLVIYGKESFPSRIKMPRCEVTRPGCVFDKWQKARTIFNVMYSEGETVAISADTTFIATWRHNTSE